MNRETTIRLSNWYNTRTVFSEHLSRSIIGNLTENAIKSKNQKAKSIRRSINEGLLQHGKLIFT